MLSDIPKCTDEHGSTSMEIERDFLDTHTPQKKKKKKEPYNTAVLPFPTTFDKDRVSGQKEKEIYTDLVSVALFSSTQMVLWLCLGELWGVDPNVCCYEIQLNLETNNYNRTNRDIFPGRVSR